jgi:hypothetical protein
MNETMYWEIEFYTSPVINLMQEGPKIFSEKLTKKQVEEFIGKKLRVARSWENPQIIATAWVDIGSYHYVDQRKKRGKTTRYYMIEY